MTLTGIKQKLKEKKQKATWQEENNMTVKKIFKDEESISKEIWRLKKEGYKRISNCYWYETWKNGEKEIEIERDF